MKKILSVLLASLLLLSTSATAFAMETETNADNWLVSANQHQIIHNAKIAAETGQNVTLTTKILSDLSDNHFELVEVGDTGYMIFDPQSGKYLEEALDSPSPYLGLSENLYYFGPLNYYQLSGDKFVHTVIHNEYDMSFAECRSLQSAFDTALQNSRTQKDTEVLALMQTNLNSRANFDIFAEVGRNRPVIVFGYFPDSPGQVQSRGKVFHAVTAYGTSTSGLVTKLIVHYGWSGYSHVTLDGGLVGSSTQFVLN